MAAKMKTYADLLPCIPRRSFEYEIDQETKRVIVLRPKYISKFGRTIMIPLLKQKFFKINLDEIGSLVWQNCDGRNSVENIVKIMQDEYKESQDQLLERAVQFILQLQKQKFIELDRLE